MAACGARAAAGNAGDRVPRPPHRLMRSAIRLRAFHQGLNDSGLCRRPERGDRISLGRESNRSTAGAGGRTGSPPGCRDRCSRRSSASRPRPQPRRSRSYSSAATTRSSLGLVASLARPGGNLTGINWFSGELAAKRLELLRELVPAATRVAVLVNPAFATLTENTLRDVEAAARAMGLQIQVLSAGYQPRNRCRL